MLKLLVPLAVLVLVIAVSVFSDRPQPPADFTFVNRGDVTTLDLQRMSWMQDFRVARALFEGLVRQDQHSPNLDFVPATAESWTVSKDRRTYTFTIRQDARWSNGEPVLAGHFVYAWRRAMLPDLASDYAGRFMMIQGAQRFYDWRAEQLAGFDPEVTTADQLWAETLERFDRWVALKAPDERTLTVTLERPVPFFLELCAFGVFYPVYPPVVSQYEQPNPVTGRLDFRLGWTKPDNLVSNGPFTLELWRFKRDMRLEKNPHYWDRDNVHIDSVAIPSVDDPNAAILAFNSGAVDWVSDVSVPYRGDIVDAKHEYYDRLRAEHDRWVRGGRVGTEPPDVDALIAQGLDPVEIDRRLPPDPRNHIHTFPAFATYWYNFNCQPTLKDGRDNPFHDPRVRRAFAMAIDKRRITDDIRRTGETPAHSLIPPGSLPGYNPPEGVPYDPAAAAELLAQAGYPGGEGFITVEMLFNKDAGHDIIAQSIKNDWERHLGVKVRLEQKEVKVFRDDLKNQQFMTSRAGWYGDYGDPTTFLDLLHTDDGNNDRKYSNPEYDALLAQAAEETDPDARLRILERAEAIIMNQDLPMVPIFHYTTLYMFDATRFTGIASHPRGRQYLSNIDVFDDGKGPDTPRARPAEPRENDA